MHGASKRFILIIVLIISPLSGFVIDLYTPSMPALTQFFHTSSSTIKLTMPITLIGLGSGQFFFGGFSDVYGRKKPLLTGLIIFILATIAILFSHSIVTFFVLRFIQGFSTSATTVSIKAINADIFEGDELIKASIYYAAVWSSSPIIAPFVGSYLQHYSGWHANFLTLLGASIVMTIFVCFLPETSHHQTKFHPIKIFKQYLITLSHPRFMSGVLSIGIGYTYTILFSLIGPFIIVNELNKKITSFGHIALALGCMTLLGSLTTKELMKHFPAKYLARMAIFVIFLAMFAFFFGSLFVNHSLLLFTIPIFIAVLLEAVYYPIYVASCMSIFEKNKGVASATTGIFVCIISFIITFIASFIPTTSLLPVASIYLIMSMIVVIAYLKKFYKAFL
jgi:Bcr/CflA subfamily drug resistance transporter